MSWVKRRGHTTPNPPAAGAAATPPVQMYDPNQHATQSVSVLAHLPTVGLLLMSFIDF